MSGGKDGHTLFHRIILATTMSSSKTAKNWHLKVKYIEYNVVIPKGIASESACKKSVNS